jgi:hypothetical protein
MNIEPVLRVLERLDAPYALIGRLRDCGPRIRAIDP